MLSFIAEAANTGNLTYGGIIIALASFTAWLIRDSFRRGEKREDELALSLVAARKEAREERDLMRKEVVDTLRELANAQEAQYDVTASLIDYFRTQQGVPPSEPSPRVTRPTRRTPGA